MTHMKFPAIRYLCMENTSIRELFCILHSVYHIITPILPKCYSYLQNDVSDSKKATV